MIEKKPFAVVKSHSAGLFSNINKVVLFFGLYDRVHVEWKEHIPYGDCWTSLFEKTDPPDVPHDTLFFYPDLNMTAVNVARYYVEHSDWRQQLHDQWLKLKVLPEHTAAVDAYCSQHFKGRVVSALIRSDFHAAEQVNCRNQSLDEYALRFKSLDDGNTTFYLMCGHQEVLDWFASRFRCVWREGPFRTPKRSDLDLHMSEPQTTRHAVECLLDVLVAARAGYFVHGVSNMATAVLYINPAIVSHFLA